MQWLWNDLKWCRNYLLLISVVTLDVANHFNNQPSTHLAGLRSRPVWHVARSSAVHGLRGVKKRLQQVQRSCFRFKTGECWTLLLCNWTPRCSVGLVSCRLLSPSLLFASAHRMPWNTSQWRRCRRSSPWSRRTPTRWYELACKTSTTPTAGCSTWSDGRGGESSLWFVKPVLLQMFQLS